MMPMAEIIMPQLASTVPAFLAKLWKMVDDPDTDNLITWGDTGDSFVIMHQAAFLENILPNYYKHSNLASFVRNLYMYGFNKSVNTSEKDPELEYSHPYFRRGQGFLLQDIKTKKVIIMAYIEKNLSTYFKIFSNTFNVIFLFRRCQWQKPVCLKAPLLFLPSWPNYGKWLMIQKQIT